MNINTICAKICFLCIIAGTILMFLLIWGNPHDDYVMRGVLSVIVVFISAFMTLIVNKVVKLLSN